LTLTIKSNEFSQPDYTIWFTADDGRELNVGRIFYPRAGTPKDPPWFWGVYFFQRRGRTPPHQDYAGTEDEAKSAWKRCWESADVPIRWPPVLQRPGDPCW
jgi:hypothetical protein